MGNRSKEKMMEIIKMVAYLDYEHKDDSSFKYLRDEEEYVNAYDQLKRVRRKPEYLAELDRLRKERKNGHKPEQKQEPKQEQNPETETKNEDPAAEEPKVIFTDPIQDNYPDPQKTAEVIKNIQAMSVPLDLKKFITLKGKAATFICDGEHVKLIPTNEIKVNAQGQVAFPTRAAALLFVGEMVKALEEFDFQYGRVAI